MKYPMMVAAVAAALALTGCATRAVIADLETDKVTVEATGNDMSVINAEARRGCAIHDRTPVAISSRCLDQYCVRQAYLYACQE